MGILDARLGENKSTLLHNPNPAFFHFSLQMDSCPLKQVGASPQQTANLTQPQGLTPGLQPCFRQREPEEAGRLQKRGKNKTRFVETAIPDDTFLLFFHRGKTHITKFTTSEGTIQ